MDKDPLNKSCARTWCHAPGCACKIQVGPVYTSPAPSKDMDHIYIHILHLAASVRPVLYTYYPLLTAMVNSAAHLPALEENEPILFDLHLLLKSPLTGACNTPSTLEGCPSRPKTKTMNRPEDLKGGTRVAQVALTSRKTTGQHPK